MADQQSTNLTVGGERAETSGPHIHVAPSPHLGGEGLTTRRMMIDVLIGLAPVMIMAVVVFQWYAVKQVGLCVLAALAAEAIFTLWRGRQPTLQDGSAAVTGLILGLSLPWSAPWYVGLIGAFAAVGLGKIIFGGLGQNLFNPAMVGRAFVMIAFPAALGASAYAMTGSQIDVITQATPLTAAQQQSGDIPGVWAMFIGNTNGSLGETSALACLLGGLYLCFRRSASWEIPAGIIGAVVVLAGIENLLNPGGSFTLLHQVFGGALLFGAFFIATDPVSSPLTPWAKAIFGIGIGALVMLMRRFSGYPEGVMFAVLLMNAVAPLLNRWTIPTPVGGPVPVKTAPAKK